MKLARQYFLEMANPQPQRTRFIARRQSYHGTTLGSLSMGGHVYRREPFQPLLLDNISNVSPCYAYRGKKDGESDAEYVRRLAEELDAEFQRVGPETVCAFVAEPVVGAVRLEIRMISLTMPPLTQRFPCTGSRMCSGRARLLPSYESRLR